MQNKRLLYYILKLTSPFCEKKSKCIGLNKSPPFYVNTINL
jgi:hypothetical protein